MILRQLIQRFSVGRQEFLTEIPDLGKLLLHGKYRLPYGLLRRPEFRIARLLLLDALEVCRDLVCRNT